MKQIFKVYRNCHRTKAKKIGTNGVLELRIKADSQDDEQISHQGDQIHDKKEGKEWLLVLRARRESHEVKFSKCRQVTHFHGIVCTRKKNYIVN